MLTKVLFLAATELSEADSYKDVYSIANSILFGPKVKKLPTHDSVQDIS